MTIYEAKKIMRRNFIGPDELKKIAAKLNIADPFSLGKIPAIPFSAVELRKMSRDFILILGLPKNRQGEKLTLNSMRVFFGVDPQISEPCFYNQDWYLKEQFACEENLQLIWYLIKKTVGPKTRGQDPETMKQIIFPPAILTAFTFFADYLLSGEILWENDYIWCFDRDHNGDRIYTGRYLDPDGINKNGYNIHRRLSLHSCYGAVTMISK